jgi:hypothetical protein
LEVHPFVNDVNCSLCTAARPAQGANPWIASSHPNWPGAPPIPAPAGAGPIPPNSPAASAVFDGQDRIALKDGWFLIKGGEHFFLEHSTTEPDLQPAMYCTFPIKLELILAGDTLLRILTGPDVPPPRPPPQGAPPGPGPVRPPVPPNQQIPIAVGPAAPGINMFPLPGGGAIPMPQPGPMQMPNGMMPIPGAMPNGPFPGANGPFPVPGHGPVPMPNGPVPVQNGLPMHIPGPGMALPFPIPMGNPPPPGAGNQPIGMPGILAMSPPLNLPAPFPPTLHMRMAMVDQNMPMPEFRKPEANPSSVLPSYKGFNFATGQDGKRAVVQINPSGVGAPKSSGNAGVEIPYGWN